MSRSQTEIEVNASALLVVFVYIGSASFIAWLVWQLVQWVGVNL